MKERKREREKIERKSERVSLSLAVSYLAFLSRRYIDGLHQSSRSHSGMTTVVQRRRDDDDDYDDDEGWQRRDQSDEAQKEREK